MGESRAQASLSGVSSRRVQKAMRELEALVAARPEDVRSRVRLARLHRLAGDLAEASRWYRDGADQLIARGLPLKAIALVRELLEARPDDTEALFVLARAFARTARRRGDTTAEVAIPIGTGKHHVARPLEVEITGEPVLDASELVAVHEVEELEADEERTPVPARRPKGARTTSGRHVLPDEPPRTTSGRHKLPADAPPRTTSGRHKLPPDGLPKTSPGRPRVTAEQLAAEPARTTSGRHKLPTEAAKGSVFAALLREATGVFRSSSSRPVEVAPAARPPPLPRRAAAPPAELPDADWDGPTTAMSSAELDALARATVKGQPVPAAQAQAALERVPLFSQLGAAAFRELTAGVVLRPLAAGETLFQQGDDATSFFLVAEGEIELSRLVRGQQKGLYSARDGEVFGVFGLFSGQKRASLARARRSTTVLEVPAGALGRLVQHHPPARKVVRDFYTQRLLTGLFAVLPGFESLASTQRLIAAQAFVHRDVPAGTRLGEPGAVANTLLLVERGELVVVRPHGPGRTEQVARVGRGQLLGVLSGLVGRPSTCSVIAHGEVTVAELSTKSFAALLVATPELRVLPERLREEGLLVYDQLFVADGLTGDAPSA